MLALEMGLLIEIKARKISRWARIKTAIRKRKVDAAIDDPSDISILLVFSFLSKINICYFIFIKT